MHLFSNKSLWNFKMLTTVYHYITESLKNIIRVYLQTWVKVKVAALCVILASHLFYRNMKVTQKSIFRTPTYIWNMQKCLICITTSSRHLPPLGSSLSSSCLPPSPPHLRSTRYHTSVTISFAAPLTARIPDTGERGMCACVSECVPESVSSY